MLLSPQPAISRSLPSLSWSQSSQFTRTLALYWPTGRIKAGWVFWWSKRSDQLQARIWPLPPANRKLKLTNFKSNIQDYYKRKRYESNVKNVWHILRVEVNQELRLQAKLILCKKLRLQAKLILCKKFKNYSKTA